MDFRKYLADEFAERASRNPSYSLRAFAKNLNVDSSYLSKILSGKRRLTARTILNLCRKMGKNPEEVKQFVDLSGASLKRDIFTPIDIDNFKVIADWYHFAILELIQTSKFNGDIATISRALKISFAEALAAVERLKRLDMIQVEKNGRWEVNVRTSTTHHAFTNEALRKVQKQILEKSIQALEDTPLPERDQSSITMAVNTKRLEKAKEKIKKFRRDLMQYLEGGEEKDRVYQLSISLFPVSHPTNQETNL